MPAPLDRMVNGAPRAKPMVPPQEYPPTPLGAEAVIPRFTTSTDTAHAFIHGQSPWYSA
jgi:hypothetical protein